MCIKKIIGGMSALAVGLILFGGGTAHASTSTENVLTGRAYRDGNKKVERLVNPNVSIGMQGQSSAKSNAKRKVRNVYIDFYSRKQSVKGHTAGSANTEYDIVATRDGRAFVYQPTSSYRGYYTILRKGSSHRFGGKRNVKLTYAKDGSFVVQWRSINGKQHKATVKTGYKLTVDKKVVGADKNRIWNKGNSKSFYAAAKRYAGMPYKYNGKSPYFGEDCATYVEQLYIDVKHREIGMTTSAIAKFGNANLPGIHDNPGVHVFMRVRNPRTGALYQTEEKYVGRSRMLYRI